jgi:hypothetical protein
MPFFSFQISPQIHHFLFNVSIIKKVRKNKKGRLQRLPIFR